MSADDDPDPSLVALAERLQGICLGRGLTIATAESCTGGRIAATVTAVAGSSGYFLGGLVSYSDRMKRDLLGVPQRALDEHGAVSAQVARAMAEGVRARVGADVAVAVTGVAGPGGGSDAKPVGLTYIAVADDGGAEVRRFAWTGDRASNQRAATSAALEWLITRCETASATGIRGRGPTSSAPTERTA